MKSSKFLTSKGTLLAFGVTLIYGILVFLIYFTGYHAMPNNLNRLPVTIVNQDKSSKTISKQLKTSLSKEFNTVNETSDLKQAKKELNERKTYLIVDIPTDFTKDIQSNKSTTLHFFINESNQSSVVSAMKSVANTVGANVQKNVIIQKSKAVLTKNALNQMATQLQGLPATQRQQATSQVQKQVDSSYDSVANGVSIKIHRTNKVKEGLNYSLAPFFINLALYLSSLIGALLLYGTYAKFAKSIGRWQAFGNLQIAMILISAISTGIVKVTVMNLVGAPMSNFLVAWLGQFFVMWGSFELNSLFILLLGQAGASINIFFTMIQVVSSAGMIPVITMDPFFKFIHYISPMYYGALMDFNNFYGGVSNSNLLSSMVLLVIALILINTVIVCFRKKQPMLNFENFS
ncbi:YhgE/Pip domain-containing protein [Limosilactobacillus balticus]|uniref:YhgE/Pip domain-containing protein n=1 Tax=Limosilactobacillus balticus TaxID=2759747 RepID=UPI003990F385